MSIKVTNATFQAEVMESKNPVLVDFYADWCMPCKMLAPVIDELSVQLTDTKVCKVNIDDEPELAQKFQVMSIPTLMVFKDGKVTASATGVRPKNEIEAMIKK